MARTKKKAIEDYFNLQPLIDTMGMEKMVKEVVKAVGVNAVLNEIGMDEFLARLTPAQLRQLQQRAAKLG